MISKVANKYNSYPPKVRVELLKLREIIIDIALNDDQIDYLGEELKWGEPSFLTKSSGTTLRIDWKENSQNHISLFVNCRTKLVSIYKDLYPDDFEYIGNREIRLSLFKKYSLEKISKCIELALKYNLIKTNF